MGLIYFTMTISASHLITLRVAFSRELFLQPVYVARSPRQTDLRYVHVLCRLTTALWFER